MAQSQQRMHSTRVGTYKEHGQSPSCVQAALETEETGRGKHVIAQSRVTDASAGRRQAVGHSIPCVHTALHTRRAATDTSTARSTHTLASTGTHTQSIHRCQAACTRPRGPGVGAWSREGCLDLGGRRSTHGQGNCGGFTRVWLAESMVASVLSPCSGTSGIVPNFCLARSEEERRRMITGRRSSCCAQGQGREEGHALPVPSCPTASTANLHPPEP